MADDSKRKRGSLKIKVSIYLVLGIILVGGTILVLVQIKVFDALQNELIQRGQAIGASIAKTSGSLISENNVVLLNQRITEAAEFESVSYIIVENDTNQIIADTFNKNIPQELQGLKRFIDFGQTQNKVDTLITYTYQGITQDVYEILSPVTEGIDGYVRVGMYKEYIDEQIQSTINYILITIGVSIIFSLLLAIILVNSITRPIIYLTESADKISMGELNTSIMVISNDEIGDLGDAIERMRESLNAAIERLKKRQSMRI